MKGNASEELEFRNIINTLRDRYSDYGHEKTTLLSYHLHELERISIPTKVDKLINIIDDKIHHMGFISARYLL